MPRSPNRHLDQLRIFRQFDFAGRQISRTIPRLMSYEIPEPSWRLVQFLLYLIVRFESSVSSSSVAVTFALLFVVLPLSVHSNSFSAFNL